MFNKDQDSVDVLLLASGEFRRLYDKYTVLKMRVQDANGGVMVIEQTALEELKKEKRSLKDRMAVLIRAHHSVGVK